MQKIKPRPEWVFFLTDRPVGRTEQGIEELPMQSDRLLGFECLTRFAAPSHRRREEESAGMSSIAGSFVRNLSDGRERRRN